VPRDPDLQADLGDDEMTVGVRCPDHPVPLALCRRLGPLATTSANRHGEPTPTTAAGVAEVFGDAVPLVLDAGPCDGSPSTVVDCTGVEPKLLREGRVPWADVLAALS
jgi:L-threonylcarbamoyladenylate synthase